ncbi:MAG TPA: glycoside hydrolase family 15 protein [Nitrospirota bacterium]
MTEEPINDTENLLEIIGELKSQINSQNGLLERYRTELDRLAGVEGEKYRITTSKERVDAALTVLDKMYHYNGGYSASPHGVYQAFWLRDIMYCSIAKEYMGDFYSVKKSFWLILDILHKYSDKIDTCIDNMPTAKHNFLHARYRTHTLEEFPDEWGHNQLDIFGLLLYKIGNLKQKGIQVLRDLRDVKRIQDIVWYLYSIRWYEAPDYGVWEEGPEVHSSSIGAVLAGLMSVRDNIEEIRIPARFIEQGRDALMRVLPSESHSRPYDMAQLSLLWPYHVIDGDMRRRVLTNIEDNLVRENGVVRYPRDLYYTSNFMKPEGSEAQWPMGFAWLSVVYAKMAEEAFESGDSRAAIELMKTAHQYVKRIEKMMVPGGLIPELYTGGEPNPNTPLAWGMAKYVIAVQSIENLKAKMDRMAD